MMPLEGLRVLDWTIWQFGPVATAMLGDLGAEVIKIEEKGVGDPGRGLKRVRGLPLELPGGRSFYFENNNRNKRSIALDLRKEGAREVIYRLVKNCDVFVQNFRQGVAKRQGLDYPTLSRFNPRLIYANASGYGPQGPDSGEPAFDYLGLARSGIMMTVGEPGMPPLGLTGGIADQMGAIMLSHAVVCAVLARERFGVGQEVDVSHLGSMVALQGLNVALVALLGQELPRQERAKAYNPLWNHYQCKDGRWLAMAHLQPDRYWVPFCKAVGREDLTSDPRFATAVGREQHAAEIVAELDKVFLTRTAQEWMAHLKQQGDFIICPVNRVADLVQDPQVRANDYVTRYDHPALGPIQVVGMPFQLHRTPGAIRRPAPELGEHTEEVLQELGEYSWEEIEGLKQQEVI